ncbi:MAG: U32 family peptidase [Deltaproteobacteria bacterium]|nr:U32 family peptidase [Deltaproteobacteria bacterium]
MPEISRSTHIPLILAPAGNKATFLAALAAGADAIYCGLKRFSARSEAKNFTIDELVPLTHLAHDQGKKVYVAFNSILKPGDIDPAGKLLDMLQKYVKPDGLIIQDMSLIELSRQTGFSGELHLSTLANVSFSDALRLVKKDFNDRVVVPRELNVDEIKALAKACPKGLGLEVFIHGALCYGVSGRCYWSSYLGGKSGLRGRCVQPCRRIYEQNNSKERFFSCMDLHLDVLVKALLPVPQVRAWKIEGRKKGAHYVYHTVKAYSMLRDLEKEPQKKAEIKKTAMEYLSYALGRTGTHYNFLPQRLYNPIEVKGQSSSGLFIGRTKGPKHKAYLVPREALLSGDVIRIGYEDEPWHKLYRIGRRVPKKGRMYLEYHPQKAPINDTPVFLTDRREASLDEMIGGLEKTLKEIPTVSVSPSSFSANLPKRLKKKSDVFELNVHRDLRNISSKEHLGLWMNNEKKHSYSHMSLGKTWWWLPPMIWPESEKNVKENIESLLKSGAKYFVANASWQIGLFKANKDLNIWAGPFCNTVNALAIKLLAEIGYKGVIISPELGKADYMILPEQSILPLGIVLSGNWPLCVSRTLADDFKTGTVFNSPKGEQGWVKKYGTDFWVYPNWKLDIRSKKKELIKAGYRMFVNIIEPTPSGVKMKERQGLWNWDIGLK